MTDKLIRLPKIEVKNIAEISNQRPDILWLSPGVLHTNVTYQRDISKRGRKVIQNIAAEFKWSRFGIIICAPHPDLEAEYTVVDGQHRAVAARSMGLTAIPCLIAGTNDATLQAADFVGVNTARTGLSHYAIIRARHKANDPEVLALLALTQSVGVCVLLSTPSSKNIRPGDTMAYGVLLRWFKKDKEILKTALSALQTRSPVGAAELNGMCSALADPLFRKSLNVDLLKRVVEQNRAKDLWFEAAEHRSRVGDSTSQSWAVTIWRKALDILDIKQNKIAS